MSNKNDDVGLMERHKKLLDVLDKNLKYIESIGVDSVLVSDYKKMVSYMRSKTLVEVLHVFGGYGSKKKRPVPVDAAKDIDFARMSLSEVRERINSPKTTRGLMENIASSRFGVSKGGLSMLRSREALKNKIESLLSNESAHEVISQVVLGVGGDDAKKR